MRKYNSVDQNYDPRDYDSDPHWVLYFLESNTSHFSSKLNCRICTKAMIRAYYTYTMAETWDNVVRWGKFLGWVHHCVKCNLYTRRGRFYLFDMSRPGYAQRIQEGDLEHQEEE